jgi:hypothetical protein
MTIESVQQPKSLLPSSGSPAVSDALRVVLVYQDSLTREWASQMWGRVVQPLASEKVLFRSWKIGDLTLGQILPEAVQAAVEADMILIGVRDAEDFPLELTVWSEAWLKVRDVSHAGVLVPLIGIAGEALGQGSRLDSRFRILADRGGLDYMARWFPLPPQSARALDAGQIAQRANSDTQMLRGIVENPDKSSRRSRGI